MDLSDLETSWRHGGGVAALDPRWKLAAVAVAMVMLLLLRTAVWSAVGLGGALVLVLWAGLPWRWVGKRLGGLAIVLGLFALPLPFLMPGDGPAAASIISYQGLHMAALLMCKSASVLLLALFVIGTTPLHEALAAARALHAPRVLVHLALLTHRYAFVLADEMSRLRTALRVRGFARASSGHRLRTIGYVAGGLMVRGHERAERVTQAMRCRGFEGELHRLGRWQTRLGDVGLFAALVGAASGIAVLDWLHM